MSLKNLSVKNKIPRIYKDKLKNKKINLLYKRFEKSININENFGVAVSGGSDSLALAFFAKIYSIKRNIIPKFFIVDHKLRPESTKEAKIVQKILRKISINLEILTWRGKKPKNNIQSIARKKRYQLMNDRCDKYKIKSLLVGHHQDDLIENFFIRMFRGSGLKGLVSLDKKNKINNKNIFRPLINQKKDDLIFICKRIFNFYIKDPSNDEEKFQRIKIRKLIKELRNSGFDNEKFLKTINNLKHSNNVINFYVIENLKKINFSLIKIRR
jgi:tRNA(Ile)-lysidine synthetase, N-terminal domain